MLVGLALGCFERAALSTKVEMEQKVGVLMPKPVTGADAAEEGYWVPVLLQARHQQDRPIITLKTTSAMSMVHRFGKK